MADSKNSDERSQLLAMSGMGLEFAGSIIGMGFLGWLIDRWAGTGQLWTIILAVVGIIGGGYNFITRALASAKRQDAIYKAKHSNHDRPDDP